MMDNEYFKALFNHNKYNFNENTFQKKVFRNRVRKILLQRKRLGVVIKPQSKKRLCHCYNMLEYQKKHFGQIIIFIFNDS